MHATTFRHSLSAWRAGSVWLLAVSLALIFTPGGLAVVQDFTTIDYPGATHTHAMGINDAGDVVGGYHTTANMNGMPSHGFLLSGGKFTQIDYPDATNTWVTGINSQGTMVGIYRDAGGKHHGFVLSKGTFTSLDYPGSDMTMAYAINSAGDIVGAVGRGQGFLLKGGVWTVLDYRPQASSNVGTVGIGINDAGMMVGEWDTRGTQHGVVYNISKQTFTQIDYGGGGSTEVTGINNAGDIVGTYIDAISSSRLNHGFLLKDGRFTAFDLPIANNTGPMGINASGQIVGTYTIRGVSPLTSRGFVARVTPDGPAGPVLTVDDDGMECPGALRTIQEAVAKAPAGATILVCPGTYWGTVNISGPEKIGLKLIATGRANEVVLQGDYSERDGFHLENVTNVLIRGFTVRDFGIKPTTATDWGDGNQIYLENADYNTIEQNRLYNGDMMGIMLKDSGNNTIQNNMAWVNVGSTNCGIHVTGSKSLNNLIILNLTMGNKMAGIMLANAGPRNMVSDNIAIGNGRDGITNTGSDGTLIEGNRASYNSGPTGNSPFPAEARNVGRGITVATSTGVFVFDNRVRSNSGMDINWDGNGDNRIDANACDKSNPAAACANGAAKPAEVLPLPESTGIRLHWGFRNR